MATTVSDTISEVVSRAPDLGGVPPEFRRLLGRCLEKDPRRRLRDIGDAMSLVDAETALGARAIETTALAVARDHGARSPSPPHSASGSGAAAPRHPHLPPDS